MDSSQSVYIYALVDPRTDEVRYVGKTVNLRDRYWSHTSPSHLLSGRALAHWIRELRDAGLRPRMDVLEEAGLLTWAAAEIRQIAQHRAAGVHLLNASAGGDPGWMLGLPKPPLSPEAQAHRVEKLRGRKASPEARANMSAARKGRPCPESARQKLRDNPPFGGRHHTAESKAKLRAAKVGVPLKRGAFASYWKLTDDVVRAIREEYREGDSMTALANEHGVSIATISNILHGKVWSSAGGPVLVKRAKTGPKAGRPAQ